MNTEAVRAWLDGRRPAPPEALRSRLDEALTAAHGTAAGDGASGTLPARMAEIALQGLARGRRRPGDREAAFELLVADASLTYACEAAVDDGVPDGEPGAGDGDDPEALLRRLLRRVADGAS